MGNANPAERTSSRVSEVVSGWPTSRFNFSSKLEVTVLPEPLLLVEESLVDGGVPAVFDPHRGEWPEDIEFFGLEGTILFIEGYQRCGGRVITVADSAQHGSSEAADGAALVVAPAVGIAGQQYRRPAAAGARWCYSDVEDDLF
ncbi:hypothetical protein AAFF41_00605 [Streptomyces mirabilis]